MRSFFFFFFCLVFSFFFFKKTAPANWAKKPISPASPKKEPPPSTSSIRTSQSSFELDKSLDGKKEVRQRHFLSVAFSNPLHVAFLMARFLLVLVYLFFFSQKKKKKKKQVLSDKTKRKSMKGLFSRKKKAKTVVCVDSDTATLEQLSKILEELSFFPMCFTSSTDAKEFLAEQASGGGVALVVSSMMMPGLSGMQLLQEVRIVLLFFFVCSFGVSFSTRLVLLRMRRLEVCLFCCCRRFPRVVRR